MMGPVQKPALVIAGTGSGCGKTTITLALMGLLAEQGLKVQPFKCGPDYIDPMYHRRITGRHSRNLDSYLLDQQALQHLFTRAMQDADIGVVEGVMGFFDGLGGTSPIGSTWDVARSISVPVVLVVNCRGMSTSVIPLIKGFAEYRGPGVVKGVILNQISAKLFQLLKPEIEVETGLTVLGYLPKTPSAVMSSRHLGLVTADEVEDFTDMVKSLCDAARGTLNLEDIITLAQGASALSPVDLTPSTVSHSPFRLAVALDRAFCFYYQDNLDLLSSLGAQIVEFSPLEDKVLPENIHGIYFGGGYPELYGEQLQRNSSMRLSIKEAHLAGVPIWAECGGFMYLLNKLVNDDKCYEMVGLIAGSAQMTPSLKRFGYVELTSQSDNLMAEKGMQIRAREFHYSDSDSNGADFRAARPTRPDDTWKCIHASSTLFAGYPHLHLWSNPGFALNFSQACRQYRLKGGR